MNVNEENCWEDLILTLGMCSSFLAWRVGCSHGKVRWSLPAVPRAWYAIGSSSTVCDRSHDTRRTKTPDQPPMSHSAATDQH
jgi:hypothetical protein